jgi:hypothetical protein
LCNVPKCAIKGIGGWSRSIIRDAGNRGVPTDFISKFRSGKKREYDEGQMVTDLIRVRNKIKTVNRWSQMTRW